MAIKRPCRQTGCRNTVSGKANNGYCDKHKDKAGWHKNERDKGNRHERGYGNFWSNVIRPRILKRDNYLCVNCRAKDLAVPADCVDHIVPKEQGGTDDNSNLQSLCNQCHKAKTATERLR